MRIIKNESYSADLWVSSDMIRDREFAEGLFYLVMSSLDEREKEYIELFKRNLCKPRIAALMAHGTHDNGHWCFFDGNRKVRVQTWINHHEYDYSVLAICCCNPGSFTPTSTKAVLLIPDEVLSGIRLGLDLVHLNLVHPQKGELDYIIEHEISLLKGNH